MRRLWNAFTISKYWVFFLVKKGSFQGKRHKEPKKRWTSLCYLFNVNLFMIHDGLIPEEVNVRSSLVLRNVFPIVIEVQGLPQDLDTASCHPALHRGRLKWQQLLSIIMLRHISEVIFIFNTNNWSQYWWGFIWRGWFTVLHSSYGRYNT